MSLRGPGANYLLPANLARGEIKYWGRIMALKGGVPVGLNDKVLVAGGGGFIGGALIALLRKQGYTDLRAVDVKPLDEWYQRFDDVENLSLDLNLIENCQTAAKGVTDL